MRVGPFDKFVSLSKCPTETPDSDGFFEDLTPSRTWAAIEPVAPFPSDGRAITHAVTMRYHAQVDLDTRIVYQGHELFVRGVQNVGMNNVELRLLCEEVLP